jgi:hypothetical protein
VLIKDKVGAEGFTPGGDSYEDAMSYAKQYGLDEYDEWLWLQNIKALKGVTLTP